MNFFAISSSSLEQLLSPSIIELQQSRLLLGWPQHVSQALKVCQDLLLHILRCLSRAPMLLRNRCNSFDLSASDLVMIWLLCLLDDGLSIEELLFLDLGLNFVDSSHYNLVYLLGYNIC